MLFPHTRKIAELLRGSVADQVPEAELSELADAADRQPASDTYMLRLGLRKKRQMQLLKQMLAENGYPDLARMSNVRRERIEDDDDVR